MASNSGANRQTQRGSKHSAGSGPASSSSQIVSARETFTVLQDLSRLLNTGLDADALALCVRLCENGANPEALATVIKEIRRQSEAIRLQEQEESGGRL